MWTDNFPQDKVDGKVFPRLTAVAEVLWTRFSSLGQAAGRYGRMYDAAPHPHKGPVKDPAAFYRRSAAVMAALGRSHGVVPGKAFGFDKYADVRMVVAGEIMTNLIDYGVQCRAQRAFDGDPEESTFCNNRDIEAGDYFGLMLARDGGGDGGDGGGGRYESITVLTGSADRPNDRIHAGVLEVSYDCRDDGVIVEFAPMIGGEDKDAR